MDLESSIDDKILEGKTKPGIGGYISSTEKVLNPNSESCESEGESVISTEDLGHPSREESPEGPLWKRRFANDPAMMKELYRYQRLMLLTLVPSISPDTPTNNTNIHPHAHAHTQDHAKLADIKGSSRRSSMILQEFLDDTNFSKEMLPGIVHQYNPQQDISKRPYQSRFEKGRKNPITPSNGDGETFASSPQFDKITSEIEEQRKHMKSKNSISNDPIHKQILPEPQNNHQDVSGGNLDLLTLAALYLESRQRIFGDEWNQRQEARLVK